MQAVTNTPYHQAFTFLHPPAPFTSGNCFLPFTGISIVRRELRVRAAPIKEVGDYPEPALTVSSPEKAKAFDLSNGSTETKTVPGHDVENGLGPDVATFTSLVNSFCEKGRIKDALEVFDVMSRTGCRPTINTYNCLLKGICYVGRVEEALDLIKNIKKSSLKPDMYTYTAVMDGLCKVGRSKEATDLLIEALEMELTPSVVTYNTLFNGYFKEGRPLCGFGLLLRMRERNCKPDYIIYSTLLHGLLKWGKTKAALSVYKEMVETGFRVDERMMNTLLRGLCRQARKKKERLKEAYRVFEHMRSGNYVVYACTYDLVVESFCNGKELDSAFENLNEMIRVGYSPKTFTFNFVMYGLCGVGEVDKALRVLMLMHVNRKPNGIPFDFLINELNRLGRSLDACNVYGVALKRGVVPKSKPQYLVVQGSS
ncbi:pentatricopeptide repeat-containing protein [Striga asiatica]|uniref:Pentatricopeptide repeat-containing protein n=1 Tax=Striga asiatica TaxID=4170 RepID=A0A5A7RDV2_STRAF|nr:pentatricopeptide repeat-containing protein [Striga asiatica]